MSTKQLQQAWDDLGQLDPFWAMTGINKFDNWDLDEFFETGTYEVSGLMEVINRLQYPVGREAVLDFGCGVGRLAPALRTYFQHYYGLDIAASLITKAQDLHVNLSNCAFKVNEADNLQIFPDHQFDLIYSFGVLGFIPQKSVVKNYLTEFIRVLRPGGLLCFQLHSYIKPLYRTQPRRRLYRMLQAFGVSKDTLYNKLKLYPQSMHFMPERDVLTFLQTQGVRVLEVSANTPPDAPHQHNSYYVTKD